MPGLLPSESRLPQLPALLDAAGMGEVLRAAVGVAAESTRHCEIERVKYQPGRNCLVVYRLAAGALPAAEDLRVACRTYEAGGARRRYERSLRAEPAHEGAGGVLHLPAQEAVAWIFPRDRKLVHLPRLMDRAALRRDAVPALSRALRPTVPHAILAEHALVHYVPEHTCSVRLVLAWPDRCVTVYGKTYDDATGAHAFAQMRQAWQLSAGCDDLRLPRALHYAPGVKTLWQAALEGTPMPGLEGQETRCAQRLARALVAFHALPLTALPVVTADGLTARVATSARLIGMALPDERARLAALCARLDTTSLAALCKGPGSTLHGDLHPGNMLISEAAVSLIDLDSLRHGPAALDLGSFVASEVYRGALLARPAEEVLGAAAEFCARYAASSVTPVSPRALATATALALLTERAHRCITRLKPGRLGLVASLLALADALLTRERLEARA